MPVKKSPAIKSSRPARKVVAKKAPLKKTAAKKIAVKKAAGKRKPVGPDVVREIFTRFQAVNPEPKGELEYVNPFTLLVAVVLSAQATDVGVNKATRALFAVADKPEKMVKLGEDRIRDYVKTIGLFRNKANYVYALSQILIEKHGSEVPRDRDLLETLPGVGRKTANVVLNMAFGERTMAVDTHVFRVGNRTGLARGDTPLEVELGLERVIPPEFMLHAHHWLILHGRYTCLARKPRCEVCLINDLCRWPEKTV
jgi:endonuclease III